MGGLRKTEKLLPRSVAVLGELGPIAVYDGRNYVEVPYKAGGVLCASSDGRELFVLRPTADAGDVNKINAQAVHAANLHKRFTHKNTDGFWNCIVPAFTRPVFRGFLAIIHYYAAKAIGGADGTTEWVHYFEQPNTRPAYPRLWTVGHNQLYVGRGEYYVGPQGLDYAPR